MGRRRSSGGTTSGGDGGGMGGGGGGGMNNACYVYPGAPPTPGIVTPDVLFERGIYMNGSITMDDGRSVTVWGFTDNGGGMDGMGGGMGNQPFPSPAMRATEGQIVHTRLTVDMMMMHTIHHHGIEPSWQNDGVGHISWDVQGTYTYQWRPSSAGTYFYHCHTNTVLHAEMGMYGAIIIDPPAEADGRVPAFRGGPHYDVEAVWAFDEIDSRWHTLDWAAGTCGGDVGLNDLNPDYFIVTGVDGAQSGLTAPGIAVQMSRGQALLARYINAGYYPQRINFGGLTAKVIASDGRPLPRSFQAQQLETSSAERYDLLFTPTRSGQYTITVEYLHWVTGAVLGRARTRITVV